MAKRMTGDAILAAAMKNPHIRIEYGAQKTPEAPAPEPMQKKLKLKRRRKMNGTESRFADVLAAMKSRGEINSFEFEGMTLRWGNEEQFQYTPDFTLIESVMSVPVGLPFVRLRFIEVKGAHIRNSDWSRFKHARDNHRDFEFQLWQWKDRTWTQLA